MNERTTEINGLIIAPADQASAAHFFGPERALRTNTVSSPSGRFSAEYEYRGEVRQGPAFFKISVRDTASGVIVWEGGQRSFSGLPSEQFRGPWAPVGECLYLVEWHSDISPDQTLLALKVESGTETRLLHERAVVDVRLVPPHGECLVVTTNFHAFCVFPDGRPALVVSRNPAAQYASFAEGPTSGVLAMVEGKPECVLKIVDLATKTILRKWLLSPELVTNRLLDKKIEGFYSRAPHWTHLLWSRAKAEYLLGANTGVSSACENEAYSNFWITARIPDFGGT